MRGAFGGIGVAVLALAQGCSGGGGPPEPASQFSGDFAAAMCRRMLACCSAAEIAAAQPTIVDQASCEANLASGAGAALATGPLVDAGVVLYEGEAARACLDAVAALPCGMWPGPTTPPSIPPCNGVFVGTVPIGGLCSTGVECASGYCMNDSAGTSCVAPVGLGESCQFALCKSGLICVTDPSGSGPQTCGSPYPDGSPCLYDEDCISGLCLADTTTGQATCSPPTSCTGP